MHVLSLKKRIRKIQQQRKRAKVYMSEVKTTEITNFKDVAKHIIKKSIRSAVCIDDMFEEPYMSAALIESRNAELSQRDNKEIFLDRTIPTKLYTSFRKIGLCDLDVYNFKSMEDSWHPQYMLNNKDLIVIDWELEGTNSYASTLEILRQAIEINEHSNVPFIIIYTYKPSADFEIIIRELVANFSPYGSDRSVVIKKLHDAFTMSFSDCFEDDFSEGDFKDWLEELSITFYEFWKNINARDQISGEICANFNETFNVKEAKRPKTINKLKVGLNNFYNTDFPKQIESLYYLSIENKNTEGFEFSRINSVELGMKINTSIVTIFSKDEQNNDGVKPEEVLDTFSELICNDPHNFLTLLSIEMKDKLRDELYKISNNISILDERAFFYHMNGYKTRSANYKNEFFDFLLKSWTNEIESYNYNNLPLIFNAIDEYVNEKKYEDIKGVDIKKEIGELGLKLSTVEIYDRLKKSPTLRFGDILKMSYDDGSDSDYLICITPACICVDTCKVDNNFYFVKSDSFKRFEESSALKEIETGYYSIIKDDGNLLAVKWECKPFTLYIKTNDLNNLESNYSLKPVVLKYITTSKENFAQRIANQSFTYGTSIGIDLPHIR